MILGMSFEQLKNQAKIRSYNLFDCEYQCCLINLYSFCRPTQQNVSKELVECVCSCFPEQINEIQENLKNT